MPLKIAILASGGGTNAQAMIDKAAAGILDVDIRLILSNRPGAGVLERARKAGLPHLALDHTRFPDREAYDRQLIAALRESGAELIVLAGYMRLLTSAFLCCPAFPACTAGPTPRPTGSRFPAAPCISWRKKWTAVR